MSAADDLTLIAQLRLHAPHSEDGYLMLRAANTIEDANARVALAHADALNAAADWLATREALATSAHGWPHNQSAVVREYEAAFEHPEGWLRERARAIGVGEI